MTTNPALFKVLDNIHEWFDYKGHSTWVIPEGILTAEEIESLRKEHEIDWKLQGEPYIANFLPDGERPDWIKKY